MKQFISSYVKLFKNWITKKAYRITHLSWQWVAPAHSSFTNAALKLELKKKFFFEHHCTFGGCSKLPTLFLFIKCIGVRLGNQIMQVSSVQCYNTSSVYCIVCPLPEGWSPSVTVYLSPSTLFILPHPLPSGNLHTVVSVYEFVCFVCSLVAFCFISQMWAKLYGSCSFPSHLFHLAWYSQGPSCCGKCPHFSTSVAKKRSILSVTHVLLFEVLCLPGAHTHVLHHRQECVATGVPFLTEICNKINVFYYQILLSNHQMYFITFTFTTPPYADIVLKTAKIESDSKRYHKSKSPDTYV